MKNGIYLSLFSLFLIFFLKGCQKEEVKVGTKVKTNTSINSETSSVIYSSLDQHTRSTNYPPADFFYSDDVDEYLDKIVTYLKDVNDSTEFITSILENYGYPMWQYVQPLVDEDKNVYVIPIRNEQEVTAIWFFEMNSIYTRHRLFPRPEEEDPLFPLGWMFDYFNIKLSCYTPQQEGEVMQFVVPQTRGMVIEYCYDVYTGYVDSQGVERLEYRYTHCWREYIHVYILPPGVGNGGNGSSGGEPLPNEWGGGSVGVLPVSPTGDLTDLFRKTSNLSEPVLVKLKGAIDEMKDYCYAEAIYKYLVARGIKFSDVKIEANLGGQAAFDFTADKLSFKGIEDIDFGGLFHEMFHLFQKYEDSYSGQEVIGMMEYERTLFEDIAYTVIYTDKETEQIPYEVYASRKSPWAWSGKDWKEQKEYETWLKEVTNEFESYPSSISTEDFKKWAKYFGEDNMRYEKDTNGNLYDYEIEYSQKALTKALELAKRNCGK